MADTIIDRAVAEGDLSKLSAAERVTYYRAVCDLVGISPLTRPFEYLQLQGRLVLYAGKGATDQIRSRRGISVQILAREKLEDVYVVTARATDPTGRRDESIGAVSTAGLRGDALANAYMKSETKAKRRATLSLVGLGMLDETEIETIRDARRVRPEEAEREGPGSAASGPSRAPEPPPEDPGVALGLNVPPPIDEREEIARLQRAFTEAVRKRGWEPPTVRARFVTRYGVQPEEATVDQLNDAIAMMNQ